MSRKRRNPPYFFSMRRAVSPTALLFLVSFSVQPLAFSKNKEMRMRGFGWCQKLDKILLCSPVWLTTER
jgi:hypothetical protein